jgi:hypothetical protein
MGWAHGADLGWGRRPKLHGMQGVKFSEQTTNSSTPRGRMIRRASIDLATPGRPIRVPVVRSGAPRCPRPDRITQDHLQAEHQVVSQTKS